LGLPAYNTPVDVRAIAEEYRPALMEWLVQGTAIVIDPTQDVKLAGTLAAGPTARNIVRFPLYWGDTRIQPRRAALDSRQLVNDTSTRRVDFWFDYPMDEEIPDIRPGYQIVVTDGGNDPYLRLYQYMVTGAINSSMAWQRSVQTVADLEREPDYEWSYIYGTTNEEAEITVEYEDAEADWQPYFITETTDLVFRFPVMGATDYRITFDGDVGSAVETVTPTMGANLDLGAVVLA
jgi:hypothetical protein